jgi:uncharacterized protein
MKTNPFKFGSIVDGPYFTDREEELVQIASYLKSENHLILISPRRFGKTSLIRKIVNKSDRRNIFIDLQVVLSVEDFASQLLKRIYRIYPVEKLKNYIKSFRLIPAVSINPVTGEPEISFKPGSRELAPLEDVLNLIEKLGTGKNKIIVVMDEFQDIFRIGDGLDRFLRSVMQNHSHINYVFMGSSESMIREIFEKKSSPFYRFGTLMTLGKIPADIFKHFLEEKFAVISEKGTEISDGIISITDCHPYYTQQLAFTVWEILVRSGYSSEIISYAAAEIVRSHDNDYERLWNSFNRTDMMVLNGMSLENISPLSDEFSKLYGTGASSTVFSSLKRLAHKGILIKDGSAYIIDDPFFKRWIIMRRGL